MFGKKQKATDENIRQLCRDVHQLRWQINHPPKYKVGKTYPHGECKEANVEEVPYYGLSLHVKYQYIYRFEDGNKTTTITE